LELEAAALAIYSFVFLTSGLPYTNKKNNYHRLLSDLLKN
jgi:hypothetical protein